MLMLKQQDQKIIIDHFISYSAHTQSVFVFSQLLSKKRSFTQQDIIIEVSLQPQEDRHYLLGRNRPLSSQTCQAHTTFLVCNKTFHLSCVELHLRTLKWYSRIQYSCLQKRSFVSPICSNVNFYQQQHRP